MTSAIVVDNISKRYRLGARGNGYRTLRESIVDGASAGLRTLKHLAGLNGHAVGRNGDDILWALRDVSFSVRPGEFVQHVLEAGACDHFACAAGDVYGDGRTHLLVGNFSAARDAPPGDAVVVWRNGAD